jgi:hypothetical protein
LWRAGCTLAVFTCAIGFFAMYLTLPLTLGGWFYVFPREGFCAALMVLALVPELPRPTAIRLPLFSLFAWTTVSMTLFMARHFTTFEQEIGDFIAIKERVGAAPRLAHVAFDSRGPTEAVLARAHLAAWIQAEQGGWSSFHYAVWHAIPVRYRSDGAIPPTINPLSYAPLVDAFDIQHGGRFYDSFLVYSSVRPDWLFQADGSIHLTATVGAWWLYERDRDGEGRSGQSDAERDARVASKAIIAPPSGTR